MKEKINELFNILRYNLRFVVFGLAVIILGIAVYTHQDEETNVLLTGQKIEKVKTDEIYLAMDRVRTLNPIISKDKDTYYISKLIYSGLFTLDEKLMPKPDLAKSFDYMPLEKAVYVNLRSDAKWHRTRDSKVKASDVEFSYDAIRAAGADGPYYELTDIIDHIYATSDMGLKIVFKSKDNMNLNALTFPVLKKGDFIDAYSLKYYEKDFKPRGSGPFEYKKFRGKEKLILTPDKRYYGDVATSDIEIRVYDKKINKIKLLESSNISAGLDERFTRKTKISKKGIKVKDFPGNKLTFIGFNTEKDKLKLRRVRRAIAMAIDTKSIITDVKFGSAMATDSFYLPGFLGNKGNKNADDYDYDKAAKLLKEVKVEDIDEDGVLEDTKGQNFTIDILINGEADKRGDIAEIVSANLSDLGFQPYITRATEKSYPTLLKKGKFDIFIGELEVNQLMDFRYLIEKDSELNYTKYSNDSLEKKMSKLYSGVDKKEQQKILKEIKKTLKKDMPYYCISYDTYGIVKCPVIKGEFNPSFIDVYGGISTWYSMFETQASN